MIKEIKNINLFIAKDRYKELRFHTLKATFSSSSKSNIRTLESILEKDNIDFTVRRTFIWLWKITIQIPVITDYNDDEYQKLVGKLFILASKCFLHLESILLMG